MTGTAGEKSSDFQPKTVKMYVNTSILDLLCQTKKIHMTSLQEQDFSKKCCNNKFFHNLMSIKVNFGLAQWVMTKHIPASETWPGRV
jgi:hypothetical protein